MSQPPRPNVDTYGFEWPKDFNHEQYDEFMSKYVTVLSRRAKKWEKLLNSKEGFHKTKKVKRYVRKGIPGSHRALVWSLISGAKEMKDQNPNLYSSILQGTMKQEIIETINLDIPRTFPDNIYFKNASPDSKQEPLKRVLLAFAHQNPQIGYCQGLNFIAGIMLLVTGDEDMTFWLLQSLKERTLPDYYTKEMTGLLTDIGVLEEIIKARAPQVHNHMIQTGVSWSMYVSKWFICLFAEVLPIETVLRIWDCLFYEGSKILLRVAVTLVFQNQDKILKAKNFVEITEVFKSLPMGASVTECHTFMQDIFKIRSFSNATILKLREVCRDKIEKEQAHSKELHEQQKQKQIEERKAREAALELKRQNEEKEAALKAEQERLDAEKAEKEKLEANAEDVELKTENGEQESAEVGDSGINENKEKAVRKEVTDNGDRASQRDLTNELEESSSANHVSNVTVIESQSTDSVKVVKDQQKNSCNSEPIPDCASQPQENSCNSEPISSDFAKQPQENSCKSEPTPDTASQPQENSCISEPATSDCAAQEE